MYSWKLDILVLMLASGPDALQFFILETLHQISDIVMFTFHSIFQFSFFPIHFSSIIQALAFAGWLVNWEYNWAGSMENSLVICLASILLQSGSQGLESLFGKFGKWSMLLPCRNKEGPSQCKHTWILLFLCLSVVNNQWILKYVNVYFTSEALATKARQQKGSGASQSIVMCVTLLPRSKHTCAEGLWLIYSIFLLSGLLLYVLCQYVWVLPRVLPLPSYCPKIWLPGKPSSPTFRMSVCLHGCLSGKPMTCHPTQWWLEISNPPRSEVRIYGSMHWKNVIL